MAREVFPSASFPPFPAGELLADRVENEARTRRRLLLLVLLLLPAVGAAVGWFEVYREKTVYEATGLIQVVANTDPKYTGDRLSKAGLKTQAEMLTSTSFRQRVYLELSPEERARLPMGKRLRKKSMVSAGIASEAVTGLKVRPMAANDLLTVAYRSEDQVLAAAVVRAAMRAAQTESLRRAKLRSDQLSRFIEGKLTELEHKIEAEQTEADRSQVSLGLKQLTARTAKLPAMILPGSRRGKRKFRGYRSTTTTAKFEFEDNEQDVLLKDLQRATLNAELVHRLAEARAEQLEQLQRQGLSDVAPEVRRSAEGQDSLTKLRVSLQEQQATYATLGASLSPNNPKMLSTMALIDSLQKQLDQAETQATANARRYERASASEARTLSTALKERQRQVATLLEAEIKEDVLELELSVDLTVRETLLQMLQDKPITSALEANSMDMVDEPYVPIEPFEKPYRETILIGSVAGLGCALVLMIGLYFERISIWRIAEAEDATGMGLVTILPDMQADRNGHVPRRKKLTPQTIGGGEYAAAVEELKQNLQLLSTVMRGKFLVFSSATPSEGKTTTAINLAVRLAHSGDRVLLVDADLHRPAIKGRLGLKGKIGLSNLLNGLSSLEEAVQQYSGVDVLTAGPIAPLPSELLQTPRMETLLKEFGERYDYVLLDTPPVLASSDSVYLSDKADLLFLIARFGVVELRMLRRTRQMLSRSSVPYAGLIINGVKSNWASHLKPRIWKFDTAA